MLPALIAALIGVLVPQAERLFGPKTGTQKKAWVTDMVHELMSILTDHVPSWAKGFLVPSQIAIEAVISEAIEAAVRKLKGEAAPAA